MVDREWLGVGVYTRFPALAGSVHLFAGSTCGASPAVCLSLPSDSHPPSLFPVFWGIGFGVWGLGQSGGCFGWFSVFEGGGGGFFLF